MPSALYESQRATLPADERGRFIHNVWLGHIKD